MLRRRPESTIDLQIAPMADIGFLLLCFFIISSKPPRHEADLGMTLPGSVSDEVSVEMPDEVRIAIRPDHSVEVNESNIGAAADREMKPLVQLLVRFKEAADMNRNRALVTVDAANETTHQRIVDVLNACAAAGITGVTLSDDTEEEF